MVENEKNSESGLKPKYQVSDVELDKIFDILASAELMLDEINNANIKFDFDYSGIIILYCKAIEILEKWNCEKIEKELDYIINQMIEGDRIIIPPTRYTLKMQKDTEYFDKDTNRYLNAFYINSAWAKLKDFKEHRLRRGDLKKYNTLLFMYYHQTQLDDDKFNLFKHIFKLYVEDRNGSAHTHSKSRAEADKVKHKVMCHDSPTKSMIYKLIHNLKLKENIKST